MRRIHSIYDKKFSSLICVVGPESNVKYLNALSLLGLDNLVKFNSVEHNCDRILIKTGLSSLQRGPEDSFIVDVPALGDCWLIALLAPLLGFIISEKDEFDIISFTRKRLSELVLEDSSKYQDIF